MYAWTSSPDNPPRSTMHSAEIPTEANSYSGQNSGGFASAESDKLLEDVMLEFDFAKRKQMMERIQQIYTEEVPVLPLYLRAEIAVTPKKLSGFKLAGHLFYSTLGVENWTLDGKIAQGH
jgi:peptide/nickel transport system substrate-binding protein